MSTLIHIGFHKTASTFLQEGIFKRDARISMADRRRVYEKIIYPNPLVYDNAEAQNFIRSHESASLPRQEVPVISNERLSGGFHAGGHDSLEILKRLKQACSKAKILICFREQIEMIASLYAQYVKAFGCLRLDEYCLNKYTQFNKETFDIRLLEYHRLIEAYMEAFGRHKVTALPIELLGKEPKEFIRRVYSTLEMEVELQEIDFSRRNPRMSSLQTRIMQLTGPFRVHSIPHVGSTYYTRPGSLLSRGLIVLSGRFCPPVLERRIEKKNREFIANLIDHRIRESNKKLLERTGIDLDGLGYEI